MRVTPSAVLRIGVSPADWIGEGGRRAALKLVGEAEECVEEGVENSVSIDVGRFEAMGSGAPEELKLAPIPPESNPRGIPSGSVRSEFTAKDSLGSDGFCLDDAPVSVFIFSQRPFLTTRPFVSVRHFLERDKDVDVGCSSEETYGSRLGISPSCTTRTSII